MALASNKLCFTVWLDEFPGCQLVYQNLPPGRPSDLLLTVGNGRMNLAACCYDRHPLYFCIHKLTYSSLYDGLMDVIYTCDVIWCAYTSHVEQKNWLKTERSSSPQFEKIYHIAHKPWGSWDPVYKKTPSDYPRFLFIIKIKRMQKVNIFSSGYQIWWTTCSWLLDP